MNSFGNPASPLPNHPGAAVRAELARRIVGSLDRHGLTVREAQARTGTAAADFSRLRQGQLKRFTIDRLLEIANRLGERVELTTHVTSQELETPKPLAPHLRGVRALCRRFGVRQLAAFGSVLRADFKPASSDIDLSVVFDKKRRFGASEQYLDFKAALERRLGRSVDLVELSGMPDSRLKRSILRDQVVVYEQAA
jgi:predicted nucleotidyltransferase/predicted XRE-type DNA-binding protein